MRSFVICIITLVTTRVTKSRNVRWARHVAYTGQMTNAYIILVGKPEGKRLLGKPKRRWEDNVRIAL
jgi:hypothetical protein